jgi:iron complex transport system substrate-binding protein
MLIGAAAEARDIRATSINLCTDQLLIALADPHQIVSLGPFARNPNLSDAFAAARAFPANAGNAESVLIANPDLVLAGPFDNAFTRRMIRNQGVALLEVSPWRGFEAAEQDIRAVAKAVRQFERGEALISELRAAQARARGAAPAGRTALILGRGGYLDTSASLVRDLVRAVGLVDLGETLGGPAGRFLSAEEVLRLNPDILILGASSLKGEDQKAALLRHPALVAAFPVEGARARRIILDERSGSCTGPGVIRALDMLADQVRKRG